MSRVSSRFRTARFALAALLALLGQCLPPIEAAFAREPAAPRPVTPRGELTAEEKSTIDVFDKSKSSVVYITTQEQVMDIWTRNVFSVPHGTGSGFIWDSEGHVVTNYHVVQGASGARVKLADGRDYKAALVGASPAHDIAVLKIAIAAKPPPPVPLGESRTLRTGQKVLAIGNPFGLDWTLTTGVISALDRSLSGDNDQTISHLIQTDAAINPGNSGGPLLDSAGRLIGMNTAIYSPSGASAGIGFAVPVDTVNRVVPELIRHGKYMRPSLGAEFDEDINARLAGMFDVEGVYVLRVKRGSAAAVAGLKPATLSRDGRIAPGDIITAVEGKPVTSPSQLAARLDDFKVGDTVHLTIVRGRAASRVSVALQAGE